MSNYIIPDGWLPMEHHWQGDAMLEIQMLSGPIFIISTNGASQLNWDGAECWRYYTTKQDVQSDTNHVGENEP